MSFMNYDITKATWNGKPINIYEIKYKKEFEMKDVKDNQPKICELLGFDVGEKFNIIGKPLDFRCNPYMIINNLSNDHYTIKDNDRCEIDVDDLIAIINGELQLEKYREEIKLTDRQKEIFKALKVLGVNYIATDYDDETDEINIYGYENMPKKEDGFDVWYSSNDDYAEVYLNKFQKELSPFIEKAKHEPFDISTLDLG